MFTPRSSQLQTKNVPPIICAVSLLRHSYDLALLEAEVARLIRVKGEDGHGLVLSQLRRLGRKIGFRRRRPAGAGPGLAEAAVCSAVAKDAVIIVATRCECVGPRDASEAPTASTRGTIIDIVLPSAAALGPAEAVVAVAVAVLAFAARDALAHGITATAVPDNVVVVVVVDRRVIVHGVVAGDGAAATEAGKGAAVENGHESLGLGRRRNAARQDLLGSVAGAVELLVGVAALDDTRALERDTGKETLCLGVGEDAGDAAQGGSTGSLGIASDGTGCEGNVAAEGQGAGLSKGLDGIGVVENEDKVGQLEADLAAKAAADRGDGTGCAPAAIG